jgi:hypothetical protein
LPSLSFRDGMGVWIFAMIGGVAARVLNARKTDGVRNPVRDNKVIEPSLLTSLLEKDVEEVIRMNDARLKWVCRAV